jgi:CHAT domain-containing protein
MARRSGDSHIVLTLLLALFALAAANTPELAYQKALSLYDHGDWALLAQTTTEALAELGDRDPNTSAKLRVLHAAGLLPMDPKAAGESVATELPAALRDSEAGVIRLRVLAFAAHAGKNDKKGLELIEAARRLALAKHPWLAAEMTVGLVNFKMSTLPEAERWAREAVRLAGRYRHPRSEVAARAALGRVLGKEERYDEAIAFTSQALVLAKKNHLDALEEQSAGNLGWLAVELGDNDLAEEYFNAALPSATKLGLKRDLVTWHQQLGNIARDRGNFANAAAEYRAALTLATELKMPRGAALASLAATALETKNYAGARDYNAQATTEKRDAGDDDGVLRSEILEARINRETNHLDDARHALEHVIAESKSRLIRFEAESELARVSLAGKDPATERQFQHALATIDEARTELTNEELKLAFTNVTASLYRDYVDFLAGAGRSRDALLAVEQFRARTLAEGLGFERARADDFDPEGLAKRANVTVLSYWLGPQRSFLFVITQERVLHFELPAAGAINAAVDAYQNDLNNTRRGAELYTTLVAPAAAAIRGKRIAIIPDGRLTAFNFETLFTLERHYWIQDVTIESAPALEFVAGARKAPHGRMLLIGNAPQADPQYPPLPNAAEEIADIEKYFDQHTTLAGLRATPLAYAKAAPESYAYVHFVAHGVAARQRPLDSAIILGRDASGGYKLYARDVMAHRLKARLVTISSCHGAGRRAFAGEGLVGLAWAFLHAGAHEVVAALWEVNDASTVRLMDAMYAGIHAGQPPADALRAAKLRLLDRKDIWRKPKYWAPFVLYSGS